MVKYCKECGMMDTRPGIHFEGNFCQGCLYEVEKKRTDWFERWDELVRFVKEHPSKSNYDCVIAVSGGKDSYFQTHIFKERLGLNPLLVTVNDGFTKTKAGLHNIKNLLNEFDCDLLSFKLKSSTQKKIMRYTFEKYGRPNYIIDRMIYTAPIWIAIKFDIPFVVYGENVSLTRGLKNNEDTPIAWGQLRNSVASNYSLSEIATECNINIFELELCQFPEITPLVTPIYTSYFLKWDAFENYKFAESRGFKTLEGEWDRLGGNVNYWQIESYGYLLDSALKYAKYGHSYVMDIVCELVRGRWMTKKEGQKIIDNYDNKIDKLMLADFCQTLGYNEVEFHDIYQKFKKVYENNK